MNDEIRALVGSYRKWQEICNGDRLLGEVERACPLCDYHRTRINCGQCPLYLNGTGCVEDDSTWAEICTTVMLLGLEHVALDTAGNSRLTELCNKQLSHVWDVMKQKGFTDEEENG